MSLFLRQKTEKSGFLVLSALLICACLGGCSILQEKFSKSGSAGDRVSGASKDSGIELTQRALPTSGGGAVTRAHYDHVYVDPGWSGSSSLQTITLKDAVENKVLIDNDLGSKPLSLANPEAPLKWVVFDSGFERPSDKEAIGGAGIENGLFTEVNFDLNEVEMINPEKLSQMVERARMIAGTFYVVGYTDKTGTERGNLKLAQLRAQAVAESLIDAGVHKTRVQHKGVGVSSLYPSNELNRRAIVAFVADE